MSWSVHQIAYHGESDPTEVGYPAKSMTILKSFGFCAPAEAPLIAETSAYLSSS